MRGIDGAASLLPTVHGVGLLKPPTVSVQHTRTEVQASRVGPRAASNGSAEADKLPKLMAAQQGELRGYEVEVELKATTDSEVELW